MFSRRKLKKRWDSVCKACTQANLSAHVSDPDKLPHMDFGTTEEFKAVDHFSDSQQLENNNTIVGFQHCNICNMTVIECQCVSGDEKQRFAYRYVW